MEEDAEMGEDSTSRVSMRAAGGTFIAGTADAPVATARATKRHRASENVSEDLLNRQIQVHGLVSPERAKNNVWFFFRKYNPKKLEGPNNLRLAQHALCTICLEDITRRRLCTVQMVYYWDFELSYKHLVTSEAHHPFVPMYCSLVLMKTLFLSLVPYMTVCCISQKKNCG